MFDLERAIEEWAKSLRKKPALQDGDLVELESYLRDQIEAFIGRGLGEEEAFRRAEEKFARAEELDGDYHRARAGTGGGYPALLWNFIRVARRRIRKQMGIAFIKVAGLAVGLACFILFFMTWAYERSFDSRIGNVDRIFRVDEKAPDGTGAAMKGIYSRFSDLIGGSVPEIEETARIAEVGIALLRHGGKSLQQQFNFKYADSALFRLMSLPFVRGDAQTALDDPDSVVLSESTARKLFGRDDPMGKTIQIVFFQFDGPSRTLDFTIRGLLKDQPSASSYRFEALLPFQLKNRLDSGTLRDWAYTENRAITFIRARNGVSTGDLEDKIIALALSSAVPSKSEPADRIKNMVLTPLAGLHLADVELGRYLNLLAAISLVVLLLAGINFVNLSTAEASIRTKEVGLRKIVGAGRGPLMVQFLIESVFLALLALGLALLLVEAARPFFLAAVGREIVAAELWGTGFIAGLFAIAAATGLLAGAYPAFYLSGIRPFQLLAMNRTFRTTRSPVRKGLVFSQFALLGILVIGTLVVDRQMKFIGRANQGMDLKNIFIVNVYDASAYTDNQARVERFKAGLRAIPAVAGVSNPWGVPPRIDQECEIRPNGENPGASLNWRWMNADSNFLRTFSVPLVAGRDFRPEEPADVREAVLINESAAKILGPGSPIGRKLSIVHPAFRRTVDVLIVGVVKDFHGRTLHHPIEPLIIKCDPACRGVLSVKLGGPDRRAAVAAVERAWKDAFPDTPIIMTDIAEWGRAFYGPELQISRLGRMFSSVAILLACFGLFGLVSQSTKLRRKEMGIRKVLGASLGQMVWIFFREFTKPVVLSNLIAWPAAYFLAGQWLQGFAYRATLPFWIFLIGGGLTLLVAWTTVSSQVFRAARENPIESLRYE